MSGTDGLDAYLRKSSGKTVGRVAESRVQRPAAGARAGPAQDASPAAGAGTCSGTVCSKGSTARRRLASEQTLLSKSFTTPFKTLRERAASAAPIRAAQTCLRLPSSPRLDTGRPAAISAPLEGPILDSRPPPTKSAVAHVEEYLQRVELQPTLAQLTHRGPARSMGGSGAPLQGSLATAEFAGYGTTPKPVPSCELGAFHSRWSGRLGTPRSMQHALAPANRAGLLDLELHPQPPPSDSCPTWVQPQLFDCATYLDSAMKQHGAMQGQVVARAKKRLEFKPPKVPTQLLAGAYGLGGTQQVGMVFLHQTPAAHSSPRVAFGVGPPNSPPWQAAAAAASSQHQAWLPPPAVEAEDASSVAVRPSHTHTGTDPMSPRVGHPVLTSSGACQTSPRLPLDGGEALHWSRRPASPHQAFLPSSPSAEHRCFVRELARPDSRIAEGWNLPAAGDYHSPSRTSPLQRSSSSTHGPVPGRVPAGHTTTRFAAPSALEAEEPLCTTGRRWRPMSAGPCYPPAQGAWPSRLQTRPGTSPGVRQQATDMLQVAAASLAHEQLLQGPCKVPARSLAASTDLGPLATVRQQAAAMTLAASSSTSCSSPTALYQRHANVADMYMERARQSVAARSVVAPLAASRTPGPANHKCVVPGALASRLQGQDAAKQVELGAWQPDQVAGSLASLKRLVSDSSESGGDSPPRSPTSSHSDCSDCSTSPQGHSFLPREEINEEGVPSLAWRLRTSNNHSSLSVQARSPSPGALKIRPRATLHVPASPSRLHSSASLEHEAPVCSLETRAGCGSLLSARPLALRPLTSSQGQIREKNGSRPDDSNLQGGVRPSFYSKWLSTVEPDCENPASP